MKVKKKFLHRAAAFVCALVVAASCFICDIYKADTIGKMELFNYHKKELIYNGGEISFSLPTSITSKYAYYCLAYDVYYNELVCYGSDAPFVVGIGGSASDENAGYTLTFYYNAYSTSQSNGSSWNRVYTGSGTLFGNLYQDYSSTINLKFWYSNSPLYVSLDSSYDEGVDEIFFNGNEGIVGSGDSYNSELGYLQNMTYKTLYLRGDGTYYYDEESRKDVWSYDATTTTGLDLTTGNYSIRHYIQPCLVKNYEDDGVIEKYDKYLMGEYDSSGLSLEYLRSDYEKKLEEYGYEGLGFVDSLLGRFILEHHLFQIVNNDTGEVGGYVLIKPKNADKTSFGVEHVALTVDENGDVDPDGYGETIVDKDTGAGSTYEDAEENAEQVTIDELGGVEAFTSTIHNFSDSLGSVPLAIKSVIDLFPWWVLALFGLSFALAFLAMLLKFGR